MIVGILARRRGISSHGQPFRSSRMLATVIHAGSQTFSNADPTYLAMTVARSYEPQPGRGEVSMAALTVARVANTAPALGTPTHIELNVARYGNEPRTPPLARRMLVTVITGA